MTSANSCSWSLKVLRNGILLLQWNLWGRGASRAVKYHGFVPPPSKISQATFGREKNIWKCALQPLCTYLTTSTGARWCISDSAKIFHCLILLEKNIFLAEIFLDVCGGGDTPLFEKKQFLSPPTTIYCLHYIVHTCLKCPRIFIYHIWVRIKIVSAFPAKIEDWWT